MYVMEVRANLVVSSCLGIVINRYLLFIYFSKELSSYHWALWAIERRTGAVLFYLLPLSRGASTMPAGQVI